MAGILIASSLFKFLITGSTDHPISRFLKLQVQA